MKNTILLAISTVATATILHACGCDEDSKWDPWDAVTWDTAGDGSHGDSSYDPSSEPTIPPGTGAIQGVVYSPDPPLGAATGKFPISGALVYLTDVEPAWLDSGVYCHTCVEMPETQPHAFSGPDGTFLIGGVRGGTYILVVQKGEFRRVRYVEVVDDATITVPVEATTFPNRHHPEAGDNTPSIAVALGSYDDMQDILAKIGLCDLNTDGSAILDTCDHIDFYDNEGGLGSGHTPFRNLLNDYGMMSQYQIIFVPCSNSTTDAALSNPTVETNVKNWVAAGGKWYVADWSYDFVEQFFPDFIDFEGNDSVIGDADDLSWSFNTDGRAVDEDLRAWLLHSMGISPDVVPFDENWDCIAGLGTVPGTDPDGEPISVTPDVYCEGEITRSHDCGSGNRPLTLTFPYGCGKVLFTTYHTVGEMGGPHTNLLPQEVILIYMILEIGLCTDEVVLI
jgi:hypothetical protein